MLDTTEEELKKYAQAMEEIASAPREPYIRQPGEINSYEKHNRDRDSGTREED